MKFRTSLALVALPFLLGACGAADPPAMHSVAYRINGTTTGGEITMTNSQGGTEQTRIVLPYTFHIGRVPSGQFLYVSAQNVRGGNSITCTILVDGAPIRTSTSWGRYSIADCSMLAGENP